MKKLVYFLLFITSISFSQTEKEVGNFNKVTSFDKIDVVLVPSSENKVLLNGSGSNEVELVNKNGELKIRLPLTRLLSGDNISATVYYKKLDAVEANEGSRISSEATFNSTAFDIIAKEGSEIKIKIATERVTVKVSNGSKVQLEGKATNQDVLVNSGGIYEAEKLITNQTIITANAGGEATIYATDFVDAKVRAGGNITIYGKPKQINQKIVAGGRIEEAKK
jgi:hypothetical protein